MQEVYIYMDDSGKLSKNEKCACYGGLVFLSKGEKDKFITQYRGIINKIKCKECRQEENECNNRCPEIKSSKIRNKKMKRWILNYINKYKTFACLIDNKKINDYIINDKSSKGRYLDYAQKMLFKKIFIKLISDNIINPNMPVRLVINIDEQATKSNGYYNLKDSIKEEFIHGIFNYDYGINHDAILFNKFDLSIHYVDSKLNYAVQAADFVAGEARNIYIRYLNDNNLCLDSMCSIFNYIKMLP